VPTYKGAGSSEHTELKQNHFAKFLDMHMAICKGQMRRRDVQSPYVFFDLNAGPGITDGIEGSPLLFIRRALGYEFQCLSYHFDRRADHCQALEMRRIKIAGSQSPHDFNIVQGDHNHTVDCVLSNYRFSDRKFCGLIYADPNGEDLPVEVINKILSVPCFGRLEVLINTNATAIKRVKNRFPNVPHLSLRARITAIKKSVVILREPVGQWQFSIILLTNWGGFPVMKQQSFHRLNTEIGEQIMQTLDLTAKELRARAIAQEPRRLSGPFDPEDFDLGGLFG